ncbi:MAG: hypothetical protein ACUVX9_06835, partial [Anaerolineae bacterium]
VSGRLAGDTAAEALHAGDLAPLAGYEAQLRAAIGSPIARAQAARARLAAAWLGEPIGLSRLLREHWFAFSSPAPPNTPTASP